MRRLRLSGLAPFLAPPASRRPGLARPLLAATDRRVAVTIPRVSLLLPIVLDRNVLLDPAGGLFRAFCDRLGRDLRIRATAVHAHPDLHFVVDEEPTLDRSDTVAISDGL